jgi:hypothetical protein
MLLMPISTLPNSNSSKMPQFLICSAVLKDSPHKIKVAIEVSDIDCIEELAPDNAAYQIGVRTLILTRRDKENAYWIADTFLDIIQMLADNMMIIEKDDSLNAS